MTKTEDLIVGNGVEITLEEATKIILKTKKSRYAFQLTLQSQTLAQPYFL